MNTTEYVSLSDSIHSDTNLTKSEIKLFNQFNSTQTFDIINTKNSSNYPSSDNDTTQCTNWILSNDDIKRIIKDSRLINGPEWHYIFEHFPCNISGQLKQNDNSINFRINAGAWLTLELIDTTVYLGVFDKKYRHLFLYGPWDDEE